MTAHENKDDVHILEHHHCASALQWTICALLCFQEEFKSLEGVQVSRGFTARAQGLPGNSTAKGGTLLW